MYKRLEEVLNWPALRQGVCLFVCVCDLTCTVVSLSEADRAVCVADSAED